MARVEITTIDKEFYKTLGKEISDLRHRRGYSLRYMSELTGISRATLDHYELGKSKIKPVNYKKICQALNINSGMSINVEIGADI